MRNVTIELANILSLVECAVDYGYHRDVFFDGMANFIGYSLSNEEIDEYIKANKDSDDEDGLLNRRNRLIEFKKTYCNGEIK